MKGGVLMADESKKRITPCTCFSHDHEGGRLKIEVEMPGVEKNSISLDMRRDSFCVSAPRGDSEYRACFNLAHEVEPSRTKAKYKNGLLRIVAPMKDWENKSRIPIQ
jgi:HSP20 family molecular chaperone IbpA